MKYGWANIANRVNEEIIVQIQSHNYANKAFFLDLCHQLAEVFVFFVP